MVFTLFDDINRDLEFDICYLAARKKLLADTQRINREDNPGLRSKMIVEHYVQEYLFRVRKVIDKKVCCHRTQSNAFDNSVKFLPLTSVYLSKFFMTFLLLHYYVMF